jgi:hypothetical protein
MGVLVTKPFPVAQKYPNYGRNMHQPDKSDSCPDNFLITCQVINSPLRIILEVILAEFRQSECPHPVHRTANKIKVLQTIREISMPQKGGHFEFEDVPYKEPWCDEVSVSIRIGSRVSSVSSKGSRSTLSAAEISPAHFDGPFLLTFPSFARCWPAH